MHSASPEILHPQCAAHSLTISLIYSFYSTVVSTWPTFFFWGGQPFYNKPGGFTSIPTWTQILRKWKDNEAKKEARVASNFWIFTFQESNQKTDHASVRSSDSYRGCTTEMSTASGQSEPTTWSRTSAGREPTPGCRILSSAPNPPLNRGMQTVFSGHYAARMSRAWHITRPGNPDCPFFLRSRNAPWTQCSSKTWTLLIISSRILSHWISNANLPRGFQHHLLLKPGSRHKLYLCSINMNLPSIWEFLGGNIL